MEQAKEGAAGPAETLYCDPVCQLQQADQDLVGETAQGAQRLVIVCRRYKRVQFAGFRVVPFMVFCLGVGLPYGLLVGRRRRCRGRGID